MPSPWSIRWWLSIFTAAVTLPPLALLVWIFASQIQREELEARDTALGIARASAADMLAMHRDSLDLLTRMAARSPIRDYDGRTCDSLFAVVDFLPQFPDLLLFDRTGRLVCSATPQPGEEIFARETQRWVATELRSGRLLPGKPILRAVDDRWVSVLTREVRGRNGATTGTLALVELPDIVGRGALPPEAVVTLIDGTGTILARSADPTLWNGRNVSSTGVVSIALREKEGRAEAVGVDGVQRQYGFTAIPEMGWHLYVGIPTSVVMAPVQQLIVRGLAGAVAVLAIVILVAAYFARQIVRPINAVARAAYRVAGGSYGTIEPAEGPHEMITMAAAFNEMVESRATAERQMQESERNLKGLSDRLINVQEQERTRIARELHDDLGQSLTGLKMDVIGLLQQYGPTPLRDRILSTLDATVTAVQRISTELRPSVLDDLGVVAAIESEAHLFEARTGIECELSLPEALDVDPDIATVIYRIFQEAVTNVSRHSNAGRIEVRLRDRGDELLLEVRDDGRGVTDEEIAHPSSLGFIGMRERADLVGGTATFSGIDGRGTIVTVRIPFPPSARTSS
jgi:signal transduction histidine kinase